MERGKYVSRSVYQKTVEQNRKLLYDIRILVEDKYTLTPQKILLMHEWRKKFKEDRELSKMLTAFAKQYLKEHPEFDIIKKVKPKNQTTA